MTTVILVLLILYVVAFLSRYAPNNQFVWASDVIGALLLIADTLVILHVIPA